MSIKIFYEHYLFRTTEFSTTRKQEIFQFLFQDQMLNELLHTVYIPAYDINNMTPILFHSTKSGGAPNFKLSQLLTGATAMPTYYPSVHVKSTNTDEHYSIIDCGLYLNNPTILGLLEALQKYPNRKYVILSLGAGNHIPDIPQEESKLWGSLQWGDNIANMVFTATSERTQGEVDDLYLSHILPIEKYLRLNVPLNKQNEHFFDTSEKHVLQLNAFGDMMLVQNQELIDNFISYLTTSSDRHP